MGWQSTLNRARALIEVSPNGLGDPFGGVVRLACQYLEQTFDGQAGARASAHLVLEDY